MSSSNPFDTATILEGIRRWLQIETPTEAPEEINKLMSAVTEQYRDLPVTTERVAGINGCGDHLVVRSAWGQDRPGMPTQARVWIENRRSDEAVPVAVIPRPSDPPTRVELVSGGSAIVRTRRAPDAWDYQTIVVPASQQAAVALLDAGREGWEVTGVQFPAANDRVVLLLKRPR